MTAQPVNYIKHLNNVMELFYQDDRLSPGHIALYMALFQVWNQNRFSNPFQVVREEVMKAAKINSYTTYTKCIRDLNDWEYIRYTTSFNPTVGTRVHLYNFCNGNCKGECNASRTDSVKVSVKVPYINNINSKHRETVIAPHEEEVLIFFKKEKFPEVEAGKFYNHYEAVGWHVGKAPILDWEAAARKWMLNSEEFNKKYGKESHPAAGRNSGLTDKDYSEPL